MSVTAPAVSAGGAEDLIFQAPSVEALRTNLLRDVKNKGLGQDDTIRKIVAQVILPCTQDTTC
jgi:hypothetical protein